MFIRKNSSRLLRIVTTAVVFTVLSVGTMWAQNVSVRGTVTDKNGEPLPGVYVLIQGTRTGQTTDVDGKYAIQAPVNGTLVFTSMGMKDVAEPVNNRSVINVIMEEDALQLDDVVVTAMGIKKERKALGYSVQDLKSDELLKNKSTNVINSLSGKIAGVNVTQASGAAGAGSQIILRGGTSLERDNQPLFVVDGVIYDNSSPIGGESGFDGVLATTTTNSNRVMDINPEDVENMSVLKGPVAAALYGSRAAAGAIVITTKKGQEGRVQVNFGSKFTGSWINRYPERQTVYKQGTYDSNNSFTDYTLDSWGDRFSTGEGMYDNIKDFFQSGHSWDNSLSISGGYKNGTFYLSASNFDQKGIIPGTGYNKSTLRFNGEQKYGRLTVGTNFSYTYSKTDKTLTSGGFYTADGKGGGTGAMNSVYRWPSSLDMTHYLNEDGSRFRLFEKYGQQLQDETDNPYWIINKNNLYDKTDRINASVNFQFKAAEWFDIIYRAGLDSYYKYDYTSIGKDSGVEERYQKGKLSDQDRNYRYLSSNLMLNFHKTFGDWDFNLMLGHTAESTKVKVERRSAWNFVVPEFYSFSNASSSDQKFLQTHSKKRMVGVFGEFRASYKNIAYIGVTGRNDWTSTLPLDSRSYFYPSFSGSFVFTELLPKNSVLSFGKIRGSWAQVGKDADPYVTETYLDPAKKFIGGTGFRNEWQRGNPFLVPEQTKSWEIGAELRFFEGRLNLDYTYYNNYSYNQLCGPRMSNATGYILITTNAGSIRNKGMELQLSGMPVQTKNFRWESILNMSGNRGTVEGLIQGTEILYVTSVQVGNAKAASFNGGVFMGISGSQWLRYKYDPENPAMNDKSLDGKLILSDMGNGNYMPTKDSDSGNTNYIGNREPKFTGGWTNNFQYKNWSLSVLLDFRVGGYVYNGTDYFMTVHGTSQRSLDRENIQVTGLVKQADGSYAQESHTISDKYWTMKYWTEFYPYESANFMTKTNWLRLRSLTLSYDFKNLIKGQNIVKGLIVTVSGNNLALWTNYKGMDPETSAAGSGITGSSSVGIDYCGVPATRGMTFGINLTF